MITLVLLLACRNAIFGIGSLSPQPFLRSTPPMTGVNAHEAIQAAMNALWPWLPLLLTVLSLRLPPFNKAIFGACLVILAGLCVIQGQSAQPSAANSWACSLLVSLAWVNSAVRPSRNPNEH